MTGKTDCKDLNKLTQAIKLWSIERDMNIESPRTQMLKVGEEIGELFKAIVRSDQEETIDALGDSFVTLVILCQQLDVEMADCVNAAYNAIKDRIGCKVNGVYTRKR